MVNEPYGCRSGVACTKLLLFTRRSRAASAPSILLRTKEIKARLPRSRSATTCANYFFCDAIYVVKMLSKCEPRQSTSLTTPMPTIFSAPQSVWSRWCRGCDHLTSTTKPPRVANCSLQLPRQIFFTNYTLSRNGTLLGSVWQTPAGSIRRKGLSAQAGSRNLLAKLISRITF